MDIKNGKAVVFQKNGNITEIRDKEYQVGQTIHIAAYPYKNFVVMAACFMLVLITGLSGYAIAYRTPSDYIYVDINPSIRLDVNCFDKVISVTPLNDAAEGLMNIYPIKSADTEQCIDKIVLACREKDYLNDSNNDIEFNVVTKKSDLNNRIYTVSEKLKKDNWNVSVCNVEKEENDKAMKYRSSPKRLKAVEEYTNAFGGTLEENFAALKGITNNEIYSMLEAAGFTDAENDSEQPPQNKKYKSSPERLKAVKEYTDMFGGSLEENMKALKGISTQEIYAAIKNQTPLTTSVKPENANDLTTGVQMKNSWEII